MKIKIAVDATPIISALIGGISRNILFDHRFNFISSEYTMDEVRKYISLISKKSLVNEEEIKEALFLLPIKIYSKKYYKDKIKDADEIIGKIDEKDVEILALSIKENCFVWSEDKDFRDLKGINLVRTKDLV
ncbi:MAG: PIN domain-containing protein [archaeon]